MTDTSTAPARVVLGVTGGVAAYKSAELARLLVKAGVEVQAVLTDAAARFVTPATFQALTGRPVYTDLWDPGIANGMAHIDLSRGAALILVAPASADFMAKLALGLADDLLSTLCLARDCPLAVAPAMNRQMWENPATARNVARLAADGIDILGPAAGDQACGEVGMGRMLEPEELAAAVLARLAPPLLAGRRAVITAGPTFEALDPVRGLTNLSSGKMGYAIAQAARAAGAAVTLVSGPVALPAPAGVEVVRVTSALEMRDAALKAVKGADLFFAVAAVADYRPAGLEEHKIKKGKGPMTLKLVPNPDILAEVAALARPPFCVGFAAESRDLDVYAEGKRRAKKLPVIVGNLVAQSLGRDDAVLVIYDDAGRHPLPKAPKPEQARALVAHVAALLGAKRVGRGR